MKKNLFLLIIASALLSLSSCKKVWDYVKDHPDGTADNCRIDKIYFSGYYVDPSIRCDTCMDHLARVFFRDTADFKYNSKGQLAVIDYASTKHELTIDAYPVINYVFGYDSRGRLAAFFENGEILDWEGHKYVSGLFSHKYTYKSDNEVIDSVWTYSGGTINGEEIAVSVDVNTALKSVTLITLDSYGRIIKDGDKSYSYDASGNLVKPGVTYTGKKSLLQTNKALMFVNRNYSVNTEVGAATQFNSNQLPTKFNNHRLPFFVYDSNSGEYPDKDQNIVVKYICK